MAKRRSAYLGGTFDPVHAGHIGLARGVLATGRSDRIVFAPAFAPPHKVGRQVTAFEHRLRMLELALAGEERMAVSDFEAKLRWVPSYTYEVMRRMRTEFPDEHWQLLIGADSLVHLGEWYRGRELAEEFEILTAPRPGVVVDEAELIRIWGPELGRRLAENVLTLPEFAVSSTEIREKIADAILLPEIQSYIETEGLYQRG